MQGVDVNRLYKYVVKHYNIRSAAELLVLREYIFRASHWIPVISVIAKDYGLHRSGVHVALKKLKDLNILAPDGQAHSNKTGSATPNLVISEQVVADCKAYLNGLRKGHIESV